MTALVLILNRLIDVGNEIHSQHTAHPSLRLNTQLSDLTDIINDVTRKIIEELNSPLKPTLDPKYSLTDIEKKVYLDGHNTPPYYLGNKIPCVKLVKERTGLGLREAKEIVDRWIDDGTP